MARRTARRAVCAWLVLFLSAASTLLVAPPAQAKSSTGLPVKQVQSQQWWITRLGLRDVWRISKGEGVTVAVIDSGVDAGFGDLRGALTPGFGIGTAGNGQRDTDPAYHGTLMADNIAGRGTGFGLLGVAPKAKILPVALDYNSTGGAADTAAALTRLAQLADPPDIVNMSFGNNGPCTPELQSAVQAATAKGMILVAAAGNTGDTTNESENPANCVGVVAVGAYGNDLQPWNRSVRQPYVALSAPGVRMIGYSTSAPSGYGYGFGTSDAAAVVSGTFAVVRAHFPKATPRELVTRVLDTAHQFEGKQGSRNETWGFGAALPHHALTDSVSAGAPNPIYDALEKLGGSPTGGNSGPTSQSPSSTAPSGGPGTVTPPSAADSSDDSSSTGLVVGIIAGVVVVALLVVFVVIRRRRARPPTGWPGGPGGAPSGPGARVG